MQIKRLKTGRGGEVQEFLNELKSSEIIKKYLELGVISDVALYLSNKHKVNCSYHALRTWLMRNRIKINQKGGTSESKRTGNFFNCEVCGNKFWRKQFAIKRGNNKCCSKACYFAWQKGRERSEKFRQKCRNRRPDQCGGWKGGITPVNTKIRGSRKYKEWRLSVFVRDNYTCQKCNTRSKRGISVHIQAHHIKPFATHPESRFDINNGLTLCKPCHNKEPKGREIKNVKN